MNTTKEQRAELARLASKIIGPLSVSREDVDAFHRLAVITVPALIADADRLAEVESDAARYRWLRSRDLDTISKGGVFAGMTPQNVVLNEEDLDAAIDAAMAPEVRQDEPCPVCEGDGFRRIDELTLSGACPSCHGTGKKEARHHG